MEIAAWLWLKTQILFNNVAKTLTKNVAHFFKVTGASDKLFPADYSIQNARMRQFTMRCTDPPLDGARSLPNTINTLARISWGKNNVNTGK